MLELRELVKHFPMVYGEPVRAVDSVSLSVARGELLAIYGPSGSGKTTLLMLIAALLRPDGGEVLVDGRNVSELSGRAAARYRMSDLGFVRQAVNLMPGGDALDNAALKLMGTAMGAREARGHLAHGGSGALDDGRPVLGAGVGPRLDVAPQLLEQQDECRAPVVAR